MEQINHYVNDFIHINQCVISGAIGFNIVTWIDIVIGFNILFLFNIFNLID